MRWLDGLQKFTDKATWKRRLRHLVEFGVVVLLLIAAMNSCRLERAESWRASAPAYGGRFTAVVRRLTWFELDQPPLPELRLEGSPADTVGLELVVDCYNDPDAKADGDAEAAVRDLAGRARIVRVGKDVGGEPAYDAQIAACERGRLAAATLYYAVPRADREYLMLRIAYGTNALTLPIEQERWLPDAEGMAVIEDAKAVAVALQTYENALGAHEVYELPPPPLPTPRPRSTADVTPRPQPQIRTTLSLPDELRPWSMPKARALRVETIRGAGGKRWLRVALEVPGACDPVGYYRTNLVGAYCDQANDSVRLHGLVDGWDADVEIVPGRFRRFQHNATEVHAVEEASARTNWTVGISLREPGYMDAGIRPAGASVTLDGRSYALSCAPLDDFIPDRYGRTWYADGDRAVLAVTLRGVDAATMEAHRSRWQSGFSLDGYTTGVRCDYASRDGVLYFVISERAKGEVALMYEGKRVAGVAVP